MFRSEEEEDIPVADAEAERDNGYKKRITVFDSLVRGLIRYDCFLYEDVLPEISLEGRWFH